MKKWIANIITLSFFGAVLFAFPFVVGFIYLKALHKRIRKIYYASRRFLFEKEYTFLGVVQFDDFKNPVTCGVNVKWLGNVKVKATTKKKAKDKAFDVLNKKCPQYEGMIQIF